MNKRSLEESSLNPDAKLNHKHIKTRIESGIASTELFELLFESCLLQISQARQQSLNPSQSLRSDNVIRNNIYTYLTVQDQRSLFIKIASAGHGDRIRSLFGAPPYSFLFPGEADMLDASAIAPTRVRFSYETANRVPTSSQFGIAICYDSFGREYRIHDNNHYESTKLKAASSLLDLSLPRKGIQLIEHAFENDKGHGVFLLCRRPINKPNNIYTLPFPNERLVLSDSNPFKAIKKGHSKSSPTYITDAVPALNLMVHRVVFDNPSARTALVQVRRL